MKIISLAVAASFLASSSFAQVRLAAPTPGAAAWAGPIAAFATEIGAQGIRDLDTVSLPRLTSLDSEGRLPIIKAPALLNPLAQTLADSFVNPAEFTAMPMEFKATILRTAAGLTEDRLGMKVWSVVLDTNKGIARSQYASVAAEALTARETALYLNDRTLEGLDMLEKRVAEHELARQAAWRTFVEDLPAKLAAGAFDGKNLLRPERDGDKTVWLDAAGNPENVADSPERAIDLRLGAVALIPPGPWSAAEVALLRAAVKARMEDGAISPSRWTNTTSARLLALEHRTENTAARGALGKAVSRFSGNGRVRAADVRAVDSYYRNAFDVADWDWALQSRVLASIHIGGLGFPSWKRLQAEKEKIAARANFLSTALVFASIAGTIATMGATLFGIFSGISSLGILGVIGALLLPLLVSIFFFEDRSLARKSRLSEMMSRYFK